MNKHRTRTEASTPQRIQSYLSTALYNLSLVSNVGKVRRPAVRGGGLAKFGERTLLATGDGYLYLLDSSKTSVSVQALAYRVPLNGEQFAADVGGKYEEPVRSRGYGLGASPGVQIWRFRVADVLVQDLGDRLRLFASHHYWNHAQRCYLIRVSVLEVGRDGALAPHTTAQWRTLFESTPCLPLEGKDAKRGKNPFQGEDVGGRMVLLDEHTLLLATGELGFCGLESWQMLSQDPNGSYGKTLRINIDSGASEVFTMGHRNPQGLLKDTSGDLWLTEHGPRGGDELNLLREGANYGWPRVTYGTDYLSFVWPLNPQQGRHEGFEKPIHAWVPSIAPSNLIRLSQGLFPGWQGDLLIGSLATRSLYRVRIQGRHVIFVEQIPIGHRVRDLIELSDGRVLIWTDEAALVEIAPTEEMDGTLLYGSMCQSCHWMHDGRSHRAGPDLAGIVGRKVASATGFEYSPALQQLGGEWTAERLDRFLRDPQAFAPGTSMAFSGIANEGARAMLIEHLRRAELPPQ